MNPLIKQELDNLAIQFGNKAILTLDDYAALYGIERKSAALHIRRRGVPISKEGRQLYISTLDLATYRALRKQAVNSPPDFDARYPEGKKDLRHIPGSLPRRRMPTRK